MTLMWARADSAEDMVVCSLGCRDCPYYTRPVVNKNVEWIAETRREPTADDGSLYHARICPAPGQRESVV